MQESYHILANNGFMTWLVKTLLEWPIWSSNVEGEWMKMFSVGQLRTLFTAIMFVVHFSLLSSLNNLHFLFHSFLTQYKSDPAWWRAPDGLSQSWNHLQLQLQLRCVVCGEMLTVRVSRQDWALQSPPGSLHRTQQRNKNALSVTKFSDITKVIIKPWTLQFADNHYCSCYARQPARYEFQWNTQHTTHNIQHTTNP